MAYFAQRHHRGFTLIETLVGVGVFTILLLAVSSIVFQILENIGSSRVRQTATLLAQEKMEVIRNLPYDDIGTIGGIPQGPILGIESVSRMGQTFTVETSIIYIDDPFDGQAPADGIPTDYKRVRVQVSWSGIYPSRQPVSIVTNLSPRGIESNPGGGTLFINVIDAQGNPVPNATVQVSNPTVNPPIQFSTLTNANGLVMLPGAPACVSCYTISVTKSGYSSDRTYTTQEVANPLNGPVTVLSGQVSQMSFSIDRVGSITITSVGSGQAGFPPVTNVIFTLRGSKIIGYDTQDDPVYKYSYQTNTGGGIVGIPNLEWDNYVIDLSSSNYTIAGSLPPLPITVLPGTANNVSLSVENKHARSLQITVKDQNSAALLPNAVATISSSLLGITLTKQTGATGSADMGQALFNNLQAGTYAIRIGSLAGYQEATSSMTISGNHQATFMLPLSL